MPGSIGGSTKPAKARAKSRARAMAGTRASPGAKLPKLCTKPRCPIDGGLIQTTSPPQPHSTTLPSTFATALSTALPSAQRSRYAHSLLACN